LDFFDEKVDQAVAFMDGFFQEHGGTSAQAAQ
jgi:hypothetical protein